jgi:hypothetical protein
MSAPLIRLLRLRSLLEESSRMDLERRAAVAASIDRAQQRERQLIRESREQALSNICEGSPTADQAEQRTIAWSNAESATWREQHLQPLVLAAARRVAESRAEFLDRRKERRQVETVVDAEQARLRAEQERRAQRELDDWFGMKQVRQRRRRERSRSQF